MVEQIQFIISEAGEVSINVEGAVGTACEKLTRIFEDKIGIIADRFHKDAYYAASDLETLEELDQLSKLGRSHE